MHSIELVYLSGVTVALKIYIQTKDQGTMRQLAEQLAEAKLSGAIHLYNAIVLCTGWIQNTIERHRAHAQRGIWIKRNSKFSTVT